MILYPTTTVSVYRGQTENEYGDAVDDNTTALHQNVPASVTEDAQRKYVSAEQRATLIEQFTVRVHQHWGVAEGDRLLDETTGATYLVQDVANPQSVMGLPSARLTTKRIASLSSP